MKKYMCLFLSMLMILSLVPMTVGAAGESWSSFVFTQDGPEFSFEATDFTGTGSYTFYAAAYSNNNELIDVKAASNLVPFDGVLSATVDFEENGTKEADVNISYVKTMVWGDEYRPIVKSHTFDIEEQKIDPDTGVYNNLTNGFYKPVIDGTNVTIVQHRRLVWNDNSSTYSGVWNVSPIRLCDSNPATEVADSGPINNGVRAQYVAIFKDQVNTANSEKQIDRVVAYLRSDNPASFYLTSSDDSEKYKTAGYAQNFNEVDSKTAMINVDFLGNKDTGYVSKTEVTIDDVSLNRLVFNTDFVSRVLVFDAVPADGDYYAVSEFLPYAKVEATYAVPVPKDETVVTWDSLTVNQDGPVFTMSGTNFLTNNADLYFKATAYNSLGEQVDVVEEPISVTANVAGAISQTADFEEGNKEADLSIDKVVTELKDGDGVVLATATFDENIIPTTINANGTNDNLTNGFYRQANLAGNAPLGTNYNLVWKDANVVYFARNTESTNKHDSNPSTMSDNTSAINAQYARMQYLTFFSNYKFQIDRLVAYVPATTDGSFYLIDNDKVNYAVAGYAAKFDKDATNTDGIKFVGNRETENCVSNTRSNINGWLVDRLVFDTDYYCRAMVFDAEPGEKYSYAVNEFLPYVKITDSAEMIKSN